MSLVITRDEIGDPFAAMERVRKFRARMLRPVRQPPPQRPAIRVREARMLYLGQIVGPKRPNDAGWYNLLPAARQIKVEDCINFACLYYGIDKVDLLSNRRTGDLIRPRTIAYYLAKKFTTRTLPEIGRMFAGRDHTTILSGVRKVQRLVDAGEYKLPTHEEFCHVLGYVLIPPPSARMEANHAAEI